MSNLEDVFLKINQEFAPDLFGDLNSFDQSKNSSFNNSVETGNNYKSIGHSTYDKSRNEKTDIEGGDSKDGASSGSDSDGNSQDLYVDPVDNQNLIRGSSCTRSCTASSAKRFTIYKRDWCGLLCQVVIPLVLVLFGLWLSSGPTKLSQSPPRHMSTGWYPSKQRILLNDKPYNMTGDGGDIKGSDLIDLLPNATEDFWDVTLVKENLTYNDFFYKVYDFRNEGDVYPYRYGSYQIYHANKNELLMQFVNYLNVTSQDVTGMFPQFMLQTMLRAMLDDPELIFDITLVPYPVYEVQKNQEEAARAYDFAFMTAIALALIPCVMV